MFNQYERTLCDASAFLDDLDFRLCMKGSKLNGPPGPNAAKLIVATFAAKGLNFGTGSCFVDSESLSERGTIPSFP